ncbi:hypothetical protein DRW03_24075 [Corallococcus sp. H22C18031201]|nr:hypothetical protein DRW03_24075 [Corallococcus sp. H22C18031201]
MSGAVLWTFAVHAWPRRGPAGALEGGAFLVIGLTLAYLLHRFALPFIAAQLTTRPPRLRLVWCVTCAVMSFGLLRALPLHFIRSPDAMTLEVTATQEHAPSTGHSQVWVKALRRADGSTVEPNEWRPEKADSWELRDDGVWVSTPQQPTKLQWHGLVSGAMTLVLQAPPHSSVTEYTWNNRTERVDLHEGEPSERLVPLAVPPSSTLDRLCFHAAHVLALSALLLFLGLWLSSRPSWEPRLTTPASWQDAAHAVPLVAVACLWLLAVYPGVLTSDSADQWNQANWGSMNDAHPVFHTFMLHWLFVLWRTPAIAVLAQILTAGGLLAWGTLLLKRAGAPRWALLLTAAVMALSPVNGVMLSTLWKDIPFSLAMLALSLLVFRAATRTETPGLGFWAGVIITGALTLLTRHNGAPAVLGTALALIALRPREWRLAVLVLVTTFALSAGSRALIFRVYDAVPGPAGTTLLGYLGAHVASGTTVTPEEAAILDDIRPRADRWNYHCFSNVFTLFDGHINVEALRRHAPELPALLGRLTLRDPKPVMNHFACASSVLWRIHQGADWMNTNPAWRDSTGQFTTMPVGMAAELHELHPAPILPALGQRLLTGVEASLNPDVSWVLWRPAVPLYLALLACIVVCVRQRTWRQATVLIPLLLHTAGLALFIPSPDMRYQYPAFLIAMMFVPAWLAGGRSGTART